VVQKIAFLISIKGEMKIILGAKECIYSAKQNPSVALPAGRSLGGGWAKEGLHFTYFLSYRSLFDKMDLSLPK